MPVEPRNPFVSARVRPGALPYLFPDGGSADELIARLKRSGWWGEIVGPHGSGKTTLLEMLLPACAAQGRTVRRFQLRRDQRRLDLAPGEPAAWDAGTLVVVDGCEQLGRWRRWWLARTCRARGCGLLVTAHRTLGLPTLYHTSSQPQLAQQVVDLLLRDVPTGAIDSEDVARAFQEHGGNVRNALFALYDLFEQRREPGCLE